MERDDRDSADAVRARIQRARHDARAFRAALLNVPHAERDAWVDRVLGLREVPDDGPDLPGGCVPYMPCSVDVLLRLVEEAPVGSSDVLVDVGSGLGRAAALVHLLTGADVIGIEVQAALVVAARDVARTLGLPRLSYVEGDAAALGSVTTRGTAFFFYCPFSGERLAKVLAGLEAVARTRPIRVCCLDLPLPPCPWLAGSPSGSGDLVIYRSTVAPAESQRTASPSPSRVS